MKPAPIVAVAAVAVIGFAAWLVQRPPAPGDGHASAPGVLDASATASASMSVPARAGATASSTPPATEVRAPAERPELRLALESPSRSPLGEIVEVVVRLDAAEPPKQMSFGLEYDPAVFQLRAADKGDFIARSTGPMQFAAEETREGRIAVTASLSADATLRPAGAVVVVQLEPVARSASTIRIDEAVALTRSHFTKSIGTAGAERRIVVF